MVRHIVMWTLNPEQKANADKITSDLSKKFKALVGVIDGLKEVEFGRNYNDSKLDLVLNCVFQSREAEKAYQTHPAHVAIKNVVHSLVCARECVDYDFQPCL